ncbi:hypothetical protein HJG60_008014 [Phyllostomus discolor]|uniref:Uncharacterized protein n=1 Tax=Phyllostomus discolor TaxID=89673 RepID=A0A834ERV2_9CHIR|nr:hypothetical protein HJG60_008014 [Phyllostomus discolor]
MSPTVSPRHSPSVCRLPFSPFGCLGSFQMHSGSEMFGSHRLSFCPTHKSSPRLARIYFTGWKCCQSPHCLEFGGQQLHGKLCQLSQAPWTSGLDLAGKPSASLSYRRSVPDHMEAPLSVLSAACLSPVLPATLIGCFYLA